MSAASLGTSCSSVDTARIQVPYMFLSLNRYLVESQSIGDIG